MNTRLPQPQLGEIGVVAIVPDEWGPQWMDRHYVVSRLAGYFHVVWMYEPGWRECLSALRTGRIQASDSSSRPASLHVYRPQYWLPRFNRPAWLANFTARRRLEHACNILGAQGCTKLVLYLWRPEFADALDLVQHDFSIYQVNDEYSFTSNEVPVSPAERHLLKSVGQVVLTSPALMEKRGGFNRNTEFVPMGVDYWKFATPVPEPDDLLSIPHPRIGYMGYLKRQLDWPLMLELSAAHPQWSFVFVGSRRAHPELDGILNQLSGRPNVYFLGGKPTECLGGYPQHFDACIMPYQLDDYTKYVYPLKLHEYLASGKPVVSSPIRSVEDFRHVVSLATSHEEWSSAIERALSKDENIPSRCAERQAVAREYDWDPLVYKIARTIASHFDIPIAEVSPANDSPSLSIASAPMV
jgi:glycosyltransferase involved in cell wall biosynthesis